MQVDAVVQTSQALKHRLYHLYRKRKKKLREKTLECVESAEMEVDGGPSLLLNLCVLCLLVVSVRIQNKAATPTTETPRRCGEVKDHGRNKWRATEAAVNGCAEWRCEVGTCHSTGAVRRSIEECCAESRSGGEEEL